MDRYSQLNAGIISMVFSLDRLFIGLIFMLVSASLPVLGKSSSAQATRLTIWVHGTTARAVVPIKISGFHFDSKLIHFNELRKGSMAYLRAVSLQNGDSERFDLANFYLFRWNGMLNYQERKKAASELYSVLVKKIDDITKATGTRPIVTIIAHSHGGNVVLELAGLNKDNQCQFNIDQLILLACPVQKGTSCFVNSDLFKQIYVFYSGLDLIQVLALHSGFKFAERKFDVDLNNIWHVKTSWKRYGLLHNDFKDIKFVARLPSIINKIEQQNTGDSSLVNKNYFLKI